MACVTDGGRARVGGVWAGAAGSAPAVDVAGGRAGLGHAALGNRWPRHLPLPALRWPRLHPPRHAPRPPPRSPPSPPQACGGSTSDYGGSHVHPDRSDSLTALVSADRSARGPTRQASPRSAWASPSTARPSSRGTPTRTATPRAPARTRWPAPCCPSATSWACSWPTDGSSCSPATASFAVPPPIPTPSFGAASASSPSRSPSSSSRRQVRAGLLVSG
jgi:hypothetical protein